MKKELNRVKKSPATTTRGQVIGSFGTWEFGQGVHECGQVSVKVLQRSRALDELLFHSICSCSMLPGAPTTRST
jgi:hypothetical protein